MGGLPRADTAAPLGLGPRGVAVAFPQVTPSYTGNLAGDPRGGRTRLLTNNVCTGTSYYLGTQANGSRFTDRDGGWAFDGKCSRCVPRSCGAAAWLVCPFPFYYHHHHNDTHTPTTTTTATTTTATAAAAVPPFLVLPGTWLGCNHPLRCAHDGMRAGCCALVLA